MADAALVEWLLDSDSALRWQVQRDLTHEPEDAWQATRARVATEGFGARLLDLQDEDGQWAGGAYFLANFDFSGPEGADGAGQPWTATTWSLNALREWGVDASVLADTAEKLDANSRWEHDDLPYWGGEVDCCINGFTLANGVWLSADVSGLVQWFDDHRMDDGGWNCEWVEGSTTRSSFHSTLNALKGLLAYEVHTGDSTQELCRSGEEYLLERDPYRRQSTAETVAPWALGFAYPFRWFYNFLNAAASFRAASLINGTSPDPRMAVNTDRTDPRTTTAARWQMAPGASPPWPGVVRGRRAGWRAVEVADIPCSAGA